MLHKLTNLYGIKIFMQSIALIWGVVYGRLQIALRRNVAQVYRI